jgi:hypothetical protein
VAREDELLEKTANEENPKHVWELSYPYLKTLRIAAIKGGRIDFLQHHSCELEQNPCAIQMSP